MTKPQDSRAAWMKGGQAQCSPQPQPSARAFRLVLLGAPGVGKGTQAELLSQRLGACHLSTGDIFRAAKSLGVEERTPALNEALSYMSQGRLVPDATVLAAVREREGCLNCPCGFLLDGFPRTVAQAEALEKLLEQDGRPLTGVIDYELPIQELVERLGGRRTCSGCKAVYHLISHPPRTENVCDRCGAALYQREDDQPESIHVRMKAYQESTQPLIQFYQQRGLLKSIKADGTPVEIFQRTLAAFNGPAAA
ncbi:MAG TPA: nucleoside monophosphate kinase [Verrucomicrobiae bacterium]|jgi:adenylate kinase|nr:nucleoside monophosphate kinase [Verrucomicrobiae bacterium]